MTTIRENLEAALRELGVPSDDYPAPVANAVFQIREALSKLDRSDYAERKALADLIRSVLVDHDRKRDAEAYLRQQLQEVRST